MGAASLSNVLPFLTRAELGGDWTASERARLEELAERLSSGQAKVSTVYGSTDAGDPWCVVADENGEVLIHAARIGGRFVVHQAAPDALQQGDSLWDALGRLLGAGLRAAGDGVVIDLRSREAQSLLALVAAASFYFETRKAIPPDLLPAPAEPTHDDHQHAAADGFVVPPPPEPAPRARPADADDLPQRVVGPASPSPADSHSTAAAALGGADAPEASAQAPPAPTEREAASPPALAEPLGSGGLVVHAGPGADRVSGGPGADLLDGGGAPDGRFDLLDGGAGDDHVVLRQNTVAFGGPGADAFVIAAPPAAKAAGEGEARPTPEADPAPLAWVMDFSRADGDRFETSAGGRVVVVSNTSVADVAAPADAFASLAVAPAHAGARLGLDFDGDGRADAFVMVAGADAWSIAVGQVLPQRAAAPAEPLIAHDEIPLPQPLDSGSFLLG